MEPKEFGPMDQKEYRIREDIDLDKDQYETVEDSIKDIVYKDSEGITRMVESDRLAGQLPTAEQTLDQIENDMAKQSVRDRLRSPDGQEASSEAIDLIHEIKTSYKHASDFLQSKPPSEERETDLKILTNITIELSDIQRAYQNGNMSQEVLIDRLRGYRQRIWDIEHQLEE